MIDYISAYTHLDIDKRFSPLRWINIKTKYNEHYIRSYNTFNIKYYPNTQRLILDGKISNLFSASQVQNVDDIFGSDTEKFISQVNEKLNKLFEKTKIDIRNFIVARIDYCYNVKTPYVSEYLDFLTAAFQHRNTERRINFTDDRNLSGSVYIKPNQEYQKNEKKSYCLNFYDKTNWISNQEAKKIYISEEDKELAENVLRLEVQCYSDEIKRICKKNKIENNFGNLCNINLAYNTICAVYKRLFGGEETCAFIKYEETKNICFTPAVRKQLISSAQHHPISQYAAKKAIESNIYPYYFLPAEGTINRLENPMILIQNKIECMQ